MLGCSSQLKCEHTYNNLHVYKAKRAIKWKHGSNHCLFMKVNYWMPVTCVRCTLSGCYIALAFEFHLFDFFNQGHIINKHLFWIFLNQFWRRAGLANYWTCHAGSEMEQTFIQTCPYPLDILPDEMILRSVHPKRKIRSLSAQDVSSFAEHI